MRGSIKALSACGTLIVAGLATPLLGAVAPANAATSTSGVATTIDGCSATVSNITQETLNGKAVVTFTGQVECSSPASQLELHTSLFDCWNLQPRENKKFLLADCGYLTNSETITAGVSGVTYTISDTTAANDGYFAPVLSFVRDGTASGPIFGTPALCGNGRCTNTTYAS